MVVIHAASGKLNERVLSLSMGKRFIVASWMTRAEFPRHNGSPCTRDHHKRAPQQAITDDA
jgi:hypothetical protein